MYQRISYRLSTPDLHSFGALFASVYQTESIPPTPSVGSTDERYNLSLKGPGLPDPASSLSVAQSPDKRVQPRCFPLPLPLVFPPPLLPPLAGDTGPLCRGTL